MEFSPSNSCCRGASNSSKMKIMWYLLGEIIRVDEISNNCVEGKVCDIGKNSYILLVEGIKKRFKFSDLEQLYYTENPQ